MTENIRITEKDETVSWESIAYLLHLAHSANRRLGFEMKTANLSASEVEHKVKDGKTFVAFDSGGQLVGTASIVPKVGKGKWYENKFAEAFMVLVAVHPDYQGNGIVSRLYSFIEKDLAQNTHVNIIKSGTAEKNIPQCKAFVKNGYIPVETISGKDTDYYSIIYVKYLDGKFPYSKHKCNCRFRISSVLYKLGYKPGHKKRKNIISMIAIKLLQYVNNG